MLSAESHNYSSLQINSCCPLTHMPFHYYKSTDAVRWVVGGQLRNHHGVMATTTLLEPWPRQAWTYIYICRPSVISLMVPVDVKRHERRRPCHFLQGCNLVVKKPCDLFQFCGCHLYGFIRKFQRRIAYVMSLV